MSCPRIAQLLAFIFLITSAKRALANDCYRLDTSTGLLLNGTNTARASGEVNCRVCRLHYEDLLPSIYLRQAATPAVPTSRRNSAHLIRHLLNPDPGPGGCITDCDPL
jgi:hypothetical protein